MAEVLTNEMVEETANVAIEAVTKPGSKVLAYGVGGACGLIFAAGVVTTIKAVNKFAVKPLVTKFTKKKEVAVEVVEAEETKVNEAENEKTE